MRRERERAGWAMPVAGASTTVGCLQFSGTDRGGKEEGERGHGARKLDAMVQQVASSTRISPEIGRRLGSSSPVTERAATEEGGREAFRRKG